MSAESYFFALSVVIVRFGAGVGARGMVWLRRARVGFNVSVLRNYVNVVLGWLGADAGVTGDRRSFAPMRPEPCLVDWLVQPR